MNKNEIVNIEPADRSCYICGRSVEEYKRYFKYSSIQDSFDKENSDLISVLNAENQEYFSQFVDNYGNKYFTFYESLMKLPEGVDELSLEEFRSKPPALLKLFPEITSFDPDLLRYWGMGRMKPKRGGSTIGDFKEYYSQIYNDLKNKRINRDIINTISYHINENETTPPPYLSALMTNYRKVEKSSKRKLPEISFAQKNFSFDTVNQLKISYNYYLCPICRKITKEF